MRTVPFAAAVHCRDQAVFYLPAHRLGQHAGNALHAAQINFAVRLAVAVEHTAPAPGEMAAAGRIAGAELHAVQSFTVIHRCQVGSQRIFYANNFSCGDHIANFLG